MNFLFIIQQQFQSKKSLLSDDTNNELLFINCATVLAERNSIPHLLQTVKPYLQANPTQPDNAKTKSKHNIIHRTNYNFNGDI